MRLTESQPAQTSRQWIPDWQTSDCVQDYVPICYQITQVALLTNAQEIKPKNASQVKKQGRGAIPTRAQEKQKETASIQTENADEDEGNLDYHEVHFAVGPEIAFTIGIVKTQEHYKLQMDLMQIIFRKTDLANV